MNSPIAATLGSAIRSMPDRGQQQPGSASHSRASGARPPYTRGRNRDTAWFSILDSEWPAIKTAFERWLAPQNFDAEGGQRMRLSVLTAAAPGRIKRGFRNETRIGKSP